ncbi:MAG: YjbF family lipoprotein [Roseovarius sp.]|nr:YjbF family lipoprotein [Roseovarius sp.]
MIAGLSVTACTNTRSDRPGLAVARSYLKPAPEPVVTDSQQISTAIGPTLNAVNGPLSLATFEKTKNNVLLRQIASNGAYRTWADVGSSDRRSITTKNGVLTATRGLNQDLMSSDVDQTLSLISARKSGSSTRVQRYLNGEDIIYEVRLNCTVSRGPDTPVHIGEINRMAIQMTETCHGDDRDMTNIYTVDASGRVLQSVQWLNEFYGTTVIQQLR